MFVSKSHGSDGISASEVDRAIAVFSQRFGAEVLVSPLSINGRVLEVEFLGNLCHTCCTYDYFDDFAMILEEVSGTPYTVWDAVKPCQNAPRLAVKFAKLDFLDEIRKAMEKLRGIVRSRMKDFKRISRDETALFSEMCFCILTANFTAEGGMRIQKNIKDGFTSLSKDELANKLRELKHRFPNTRAGYIVENRGLCGFLLKTLGRFKDGKAAREWVVKNVKGLGYKEASHFLRNVGYRDVAIIDRHILKFLQSRGLIEISKTLTKRKYLEFERLLSAIADKLSLTLAELDLYLWYIVTGKVLK
jgi:N-glycosylase/DNA lyase